jgi:exodeoxyribonuclease VII large subunit
MTTNTAVQILADEKILTVSELSYVIKRNVESQFNSVRIQGEISGIKKHPSGHTYLTLKDNDSVINAICWKGTKLQFQLEEGMEIVAKGRVTVYPARSQYQLIIEEASPAGEGALLKLLNDRKKLFSSLGYFAKKHTLPKYPRIIGIVTSKTGAVLQDMRHRLEDRYPFCEVYVWHVNVQGQMASDQISNAVRGFNFMTEKKPDILIIARGGGSIEDLWPFNEENVVKAVFDSSIPVISAIGHETDFTLIDYAADLRAPTPTAAIELATPILSDVSMQIEEFSVRMKQYIARTLKELSNRILIAQKSLATSQFAILAIAQKFDDRSEKLLIAANSYIQKLSLKLQAKKLISLENYIQLKYQQYNSKKNVFNNILENYIPKYKEKISIFANRLAQASYKKTLEKGFCFITTNNGTTVETVAAFQKKKTNGLLIHFQDGIIDL